MSRRIPYVDPPKRLGWWRVLLSKLPGFCSYCGKRYIPVDCGGHKVSLFNPCGAQGRACPDSHEGYLDTFIPAGAIIRERYDLVKNSHLRVS